MTAYDRWLDPPDDDEEELASEDDGDCEQDDGPDGAWGSDEIEITRCKRYE